LSFILFNLALERSIRKDEFTSLNIFQTLDEGKEFVSKYLLSKIWD
jgi:hypothetical protein